MVRERSAKVARRATTEARRPDAERGAGVRDAIKGLGDGVTLRIADRRRRPRMSPNAGATITSPVASSGHSSVPDTRRGSTSCPIGRSPIAARDDVAVHLFGLKEAPTHRGQVNILWQISHPDLATPCVVRALRPCLSWRRTCSPPGWPSGWRSPSHRFTRRPIPERLPAGAGRPAHELLFVANSRRVHRRIVDDLAGTTTTSRSTDRTGRPIWSSRAS